MSAPGRSCERMFYLHLQTFNDRQSFDVKLLDLVPLLLFCTDMKQMLDKHQNPLVRKQHSDPCVLE